MKINEVLQQVKVMPGEKLYWEYYGWPHTNKYNPNLFDRIKYLNSKEMMREIHFVILDNKQIVADGALQQSPYEEKELWIKHISVDEDYRNRGYARAIMDSIYKYAVKKKQYLVHSSFSDMGERHLPNMISQLDAKYPTAVKPNK